MIEKRGMGDAGKRRDADALSLLPLDLDLDGGERLATLELAELVVDGVHLSKRANQRRSSVHKVERRTSSRQSKYHLLRFAVAFFHVKW